jgi:hypothetical protein
MKKSVLAILAASLCQFCIASDGSGAATQIQTFGRWEVIEFAGANGLIYRISSDSINHKTTNIVFDVATETGCTESPAVMISKMKSYSPPLNGGKVTMTYRMPGQADQTDLTKTAMQKGDLFAFFQFSSLSAENLQRSPPEGNLAIWIPGSGDGAIKKTPNIYFSLDGFEYARAAAVNKCLANR